ncbi:MAG: AAA family ATPase [Egibacteraceae bacterium]
MKREGFVGRKRELSILRDELARVCTGRAGLVLARGRRRIGKSRLIEEFLRSARSRGLHRTRTSSVRCPAAQPASGAPARAPSVQCCP